LPGALARPKHFIHLDDLTRPELEAVLRRAGELKAAFRAGDSSFQPLKGKSLAMIFAKPSLRTRVSFEVVRASAARRGGAALAPLARPRPLLRPPLPSPAQGFTSLGGHALYLGPNDIQLGQREETRCVMQRRSPSVPLRRTRPLTPRAATSRAC